MVCAAIGSRFRQRTLWCVRIDEGGSSILKEIPGADVQALEFEAWAFLRRDKLLNEKALIGMLEENPGKPRESSLHYWITDEHEKHSTYKQRQTREVDQSSFRPYIPIPPLFLLVRIRRVQVVVGFHVFGVDEEVVGW